MAKKKRNKEKKLLGNKKHMRKVASASFTALGHKLDSWTHSPGGRVREARAKCRACNESVNVNLQTGEMVYSKSRCSSV